MIGYIFISFYDLFIDDLHNYNINYQQLIFTISYLQSIWQVVTGGWCNKAVRVDAPDITSN